MQGRVRVRKIMEGKAYLQCKGCKKWLEEESFYKQKGIDRNGNIIRMARCKDCQYKLSRKRHFEYLNSL